MEKVSSFLFSTQTGILNTDAHTIHKRSYFRCKRLKSLQTTNCTQKVFRAIVGQINGQYRQIGESVTWRKNENKNQKKNSENNLYQLYYVDKSKRE